MISPYVLGLGEVNQYHLLSAVRGPDAVRDLDDNSSPLVLKAKVTARLRCIVFSKESDLFRMPLFYITSDPLTDEDIKYVRTATPHARGHYVEHLRLAVVATRSHPIWNGKAENLILALSQRRK